MYASLSFSTATARWRSAADALIDSAEQIGPLDIGPFGQLGVHDETHAAADRIDQQIDEVLTAGDQALSELVGPAQSSLDARFQATSLLLGTLAVGDVLSVAGRSSNVFGELGVEAVQVTTFEQARTTVAEAGLVVAAPASVAESLATLEKAGATESWKIVAGTTGTLAEGALVGGLQGVLQGAVAAAFDTIVQQLSRWQDTLKRGVLRIASWVIDKLKSLLPAAAAGKIDDLVRALQDRLESGLGDLATDVYGRVLGRTSAEDAWAAAARSGTDLTAAEGKLPAVTTSHAGRIAWVTRGRDLIEKYDAIVAGVVTMVPAEVKVVFAALVAAVLAFIALQVWDGFNEIEALA